MTEPKLIHNCGLNSDERAQLLLGCLDASDGGTRTEAIYYLRYYNTPLVISRLKSLVLHDDLETQSEALRSLALLGDPTVCDSCIHLLYQGNSEQREAAIVALGFLRSERALELLKSCWNSAQSNEERVLVALLLARQGVHCGEELLEQEMMANDHLRVDIAAALALLCNHAGLLQVSNLAKEEVQNFGALKYMQSVFMDILGIEPRPREEWVPAVLSWVNDRLCGK
jgi:HEAT repeat protein